MDLTFKELISISGHKTTLNFFECFEPDVYYTLLVTLLIITLTVSAINRNILYFFGYLWKYTSVLLSHSHLININRKSERLLSGLWLMSCTVLLAAFSGLLRNQLLRPDPIYWIDSLQDLYQWKELKIQTFTYTYMSTFVSDPNGGPMARNFESRLQELHYYQTEENVKNDVNDIDLEGIINGRYYSVLYINNNKSHNLVTKECQLVNKRPYTNNYEIFTLNANLFKI